MIPRECKRLAEVEFPIAAVSKHAVREKSIRHGHPSTLHLWWARRPLASSRAMLLALLLPDPVNKWCPEEFKVKARELLARVQRGEPQSDSALRAALLKFIADFANWDLSSNSTWIDVARELVRTAHGREPPVVLDPFAGGGAIPLEASRLGCEAVASDLNPVAFAILRMLLREAPRDRNLASKVQVLGADIGDRARSRLDRYYPRRSADTVPVGYLWARTVRCEAPDCGAEVPIFKSAWLSKKGSRDARFFQESPEGKCVALLMESTPRGGPISLRIARGFGSPEPRPDFRELPVTKAPGNNQNVVCPCCGHVLHGGRVMAQLTEQHGGADVVFDEMGRRLGGAFLLATIESRSRGRGKSFRLGTDEDYAAVRAAQETVEVALPAGLSVAINPVRPSPSARGLTAPVRYGAARFGDIFTARQKLAIQTYSDELQRELSTRGRLDGPVLGATLALGRCIDQSSAHVRWLAGIEAIADSFPRQALQMTWDFVESVPIGTESANYAAALEWVRKVVAEVVKSRIAVGQVSQVDARRVTLPHETVDIYFTDPPYYDAVPYSDLSDFFLVWLGPLLKNDPGLQLEGLLAPKALECVWNRSHLVDGRAKDPAFFEDCVGGAFDTSRDLLKPEGIASIIFAHKTTEGWEALLGGLRRAGWVIVASWPIATERSARTNAQNKASLGTSVHLVCRPRATDAPIGEWVDVLRELPLRVRAWMEALQSQGVRGADLVFACVGPALEIFSRYSRVVDPSDREIPLGGDPEESEPHLRGYLAYVWETVGRVALEHVLGGEEGRARNGASGMLEEDARLTALFLWTLQSTSGMDSSDRGTDGGIEDEAEEAGVTTRKRTKGYGLVFDVVRRFAQPLGIHLDDWEGRIIKTERGVVRLLPVADRARQLFGREGAQAMAVRLEQNRSAAVQLALFPEREEVRVTSRGRHRRASSGTPIPDETTDMRPETTTLDRVHAAMLLQAGGRSNALRVLLSVEQERGTDFVRLANALSALYPRASEEKRLLDAMLLAVPR